MMTASPNDNEGYLQLQSQNISEDVLLAICESADVIACECPGYLARLMRQVQTFRSYTENCKNQFPEDQDTHQWLSDRAEAVEEILSQTIFELMTKEGLINEQQQVSLSKISERARETALKQLGLEM